MTHVPALERRDSSERQRFLELMKANPGKSHAEIHVMMRAA
jgi:hypothetical protein